MHYIKATLLLMLFVPSIYPVCKSCPVHKKEQQACKYCLKIHPRRKSRMLFEFESPWRAGCESGYKYELIEGEGYVKVPFPEIRREEKADGVISVSFP